ncbi:hypothetical protein V1509DRAFT_640757, partial [Lipomyces kononenkoae]
KWRLTMSHKGYPKGGQGGGKSPGGQSRQTVRDVALCRLSEKQDDYLPSSPTPAKPESSTSSTTSTPSVTSSAKTRKMQAFLEQGRQLSDKIGEVMDVLRELQAQGRQLLDAAWRRDEGIRR